MIIAVTFDPACGVNPTDAAFWVDALDRQAKEFADAWGMEYCPVIFYSSDVLQKLTDEEVSKFVEDARLLTVQTTMDAGILGFHDDIAGVIFARVLWQGDGTPTTMSHEICEELGDATCNVYLPMGDGRSIAKEACDPVESDQYMQQAEIGGTTRDVPVSNYVTLAYFDPKGRAPFDRMEKLTAPFSMDSGGYQIIRDASGNESEVFAARVLSSGDAGTALAAAKKANPKSRLAHRLRGELRTAATV